MSPRDNLHRLLDQLPDDKVPELERIMMQLLRIDEPDTSGERMSFESAVDYTFKHFDAALRDLSK